MKISKTLMGHSVSEETRLKISKTRPDLENTPTLSYILGVMLGDGCAYYNKHIGYMIGLSVTAKEFAKSFMSALKKIGLNPSIRFVNPPSWRRQGRKPQWRVVCSNIRFYKWLKGLTLTDVKEIVLLSKENIRAFIRGFYESEGSHFYGEIVSNYQYTYWVHRITIVNKERKLLKLVRDGLNQLGVKAHLYGPYGQSKMYRINIFKWDMATRFLELIQPCIKGWI